MYRLKVGYLYEHFFPAFLFVYILIFDNLNGFLQVAKESESVLGFIVRGGMLLFLFPILFVLKSNIYKISLFCLASIFLLLTPYWMLEGNDYNLSVEFGYLIKSIVYFFCVLNYFYVYRNKLSPLYLIQLVFVSALLISVANVFCFLFGIGNLSYGDDFGFGYKVFFVDGNSLSIYMIMLLPLVIWYVFYNSKWYYYISLLIIVLGILLIGSRVAILGTIGTLVIIISYINLKKDGSLKITPIRRLFFLLGGMCVIYVLIRIVYSFIIEYDTYTLSKFSLDSITSSRSELIQCSKLVFADREGLSFFLGTGVSQSQIDLGKLVLGYPALKIVEADFYDAILFFGWIFGGGVILLNVFFYAHIFCMPYFRCFSVLTFCMFVAGTLWIIAAITTGHCFFNAMLAPVFGVYVVLSHR